MEINFMDLSKHLNDCYSILEVTPAKDTPTNFSSIKLVNSSMKKNTSLENNTIFITTIEDFQERDFENIPENSLFLFLENKNKRDFNKYNFLKPYHYFIIQSEISMKALFINLKKFINKKNEENTKKMLITNAFIRASSLGSFIEEISLVFRNPVILLDKSFRVVSNSNIDNIRDAYWKNSVKNGFCSYEFISEINRLDSFWNKKDEVEPFLLVCEIDQTEKLVANVFLDNHTIGYLTVLDSQRKVDERDLALIGFTGQLVVDYIKKENTHISSINMLDSDVFSELLENTITSETVLKERSKYVKPHVSLPLTMICIDVATYKRTSLTSRYLKEELISVFPKASIIFYDKTLVVFNEKSLTNNEIMVLTDILNDHSISAIYSAELYDYLEIHRVCIECIDTLNILKNTNLEGPIFFNDNYKFYRIFAYLESENILSNYIDPTIKKIMVLDSEENTDYLNTIKKFCFSMKNSNKAAKALFIHRNTLHYRLKLIQENFHLDLNNNDTFFNLLFSFKILEYIDSKN